MYSLNHYFNKMTGYLRLWGIIILLSGMNYHPAIGMETTNTDNKAPAVGKGKIIMMKLSTEIPDKKTQPIENISPPAPASANNHLKHSSKPNRQAAAVTAHSQRAETRHVPQKDDNIPSVDTSLSSAVTPHPKTGQTTEHQENNIPRMRLTAETQTPVIAPSLQQSTVNDKEMDPVKTITLDTNKTSNGPDTELTSTKKPIQEKIALITRLLLKFSLITVCCITLFFSFSAFQMTRTRR